MTRPLFEQISLRIAERIRGGRFAAGSALPSETSLAVELGVARGTVRKALEDLEAREGLVTRHGTRWIAHEPTLPQSLGVLRSFGQWAFAMGLEPSGRTVRLVNGRASAVEAHALGVRRRDPVVRMTRVQALRGRPVMVKRTTFPERLAGMVHALDADVRSIMEVVEQRHGVSLAHAEHTISAVGASTADAELLGVRRSAPLLRVVRTARAADGSPFERSDDRYLPDVVAFSVVNGADATSVSRVRPSS